MSLLHHTAEFWEYIEQLLQECPLVIDRPSGSAHPNYPNLIYPLDYGYLEGSTTVDGAGVDVFVGSQPNRMLSGLFCTVDLHKHDVEIKLLLGCTPEEIRMLSDWLNEASMRAIFLPLIPARGSM
jgi:inorganic pyrophosphatase